MTVVVLGDMLVKHSTPCFKRFEKTTLLVLASEPSDVDRDHGKRPSSCFSSSQRSIRRPLPIISKRGNKSLSVLRDKFLPRAITDAFFCSP